MHHRHLLPHELDRLVDDETGVDAAPLRAHVESCDDCRAQLRALRAIAARLDALPHFRPHHDFANRVMTRVQVLAPWYMTLAAQVRALVPQHAGLRVLAAVGATLVGTAIVVGALWLAVHADLLVWRHGTLVNQGLTGVWTGLAATRTLVASRGDLNALALGAAATTVTALGAVIAFRRVAATARANRS